jgi:hypothetical protein
MRDVFFQMTSKTYMQDDHLRAVGCLNNKNFAYLFLTNANNVASTEKIVQVHIAVENIKNLTICLSRPIF